jgi:branched-chain amino acid transport system permease protein
MQANQTVGAPMRKMGYAAMAVVLAVLPFIIQHSLGNSWVRNLDFAMLYIMLALGLNIVVGYAGLLDLGYIAFYAVGAYTYALLNSPHLGPMLAGTHFEWLLHAPLWLVLPMAAFLAGMFGMLLGAPTLKLRGDYLAIVTLGFGEIVRLFMNNLDRPINITNGPQGINLIEPVHLLGHNFNESLTIAGIEFSKIHLY